MQSKFPRLSDKMRRINLLYEYGKNTGTHDRGEYVYTATRIDDQVTVKGYTLPIVVEPKLRLIMSIG